MNKRYTVQADINELAMLQRALAVCGTAMREGFEPAADDADIERCGDLHDKVTLLRERDADEVVRPEDRWEAEFEAGQAAHVAECWKTVLIDDFMEEAAALEARIVKEKAETFRKNHFVSIYGGDEGKHTTHVELEEDVLKEIDER